MEAQTQGEYPFSIDVKGSEVAYRGRTANTRKVGDRGSIKID
jgi:hypothetical protein